MQSDEKELALSAADAEAKTAKSGLPSRIISEKSDQIEKLMHHHHEITRQKPKPLDDYL